MGFTIEDMLIISQDKYNMKLIGGKNGWANSISWLLMVEDTMITQNFRGKELAVTTGLGFDTTEKLMELVEILDGHHAAGLIINTGYYIKKVPTEVIDYCNAKDLPLMTAPWNVVMSEMIKDLTVRIFFQSQTDEQISGAFIRAIENPMAESEYRDRLSEVFDVDGKFQCVLIATEDLDSMDSVERKRIGYRLQIYLENISHNAHFFYYAGYFVLILNAVEEADTFMIIDGFTERTRRRMPDQTVYVGLGSAVADAKNISLSFKRAAFALDQARKTKQSRVEFDDLGLERLFYSISDEAIKVELGEQLLAPLLEYDDAHGSDFVETLYQYLRFDGSVKQVAETMYIHKNTILYRMGKIKEILDCDLTRGEDRLRYYLACFLIR